MTSALFSAENETEVRILVRSSPEYPVAGSIWTLSLLIAHHEPDEVNVLAPQFTGSLMLDRIIKVPRFFNPATGQIYISRSDEAIPTAYERWTVMEYRFLLSSSGTVSFDAFTVITPQGQAETAPFDLRVQRPQNTAVIQNYRLAWEEIPAHLIIGDSAVFFLRISGWNSMNPLTLPPEAMFLPFVPPGYILESVPLRPEERSEGIALKLRLIPLENGAFILEKYQVTYNGVIFEIPALRIPVSAAVDNRVLNTTAALNESAQQDGSSVPPFPALETAIKDHSGLYQKHRVECEAIYTALKKLWESGDCANALASLRKNERDHPGGAIFAVLRRGAESTIGITGANNEKKRLLFFLKEKSRSAVLRETAVRHIPDRDGEEITRFREGQPVLLSGTVQTRQETWLWVITNDDRGISGWVPEENIIFY